MRPDIRRLSRGKRVSDRPSSRSGPSRSDKRPEYSEPSSPECNLPPCSARSLCTQLQIGVPNRLFWVPISEGYNELEDHPTLDLSAFRRPMSLRMSCRISVPSLQLGPLHSISTSLRSSSPVGHRARCRTKPPSTRKTTVPRKLTLCPAGT